ncbi:hypothetical protein M427DRAFT_491238, partial [Gonapodya prolifera JEL478]
MLHLKSGSVMDGLENRGRGVWKADMHKACVVMKDPLYDSEFPPLSMSSVYKYMLQQGKACSSCHAITPLPVNMEDIGRPGENYWDDRFGTIRVEELLKKPSEYVNQAVPYLKGNCYFCWATNVGNSGVFFDDASILALCKALNVTVTVFQRGNCSMFHFIKVNSIKNCTSINLLLSGNVDAGHYSLLSEEDSNLRFKTVTRSMTKQPTKTVAIPVMDNPFQENNSNSVPTMAHMTGGGPPSVATDLEELDYTQGGGNGDGFAQNRIEWTHLDTVLLPNVPLWFDNQPFDWNKDGGAKHYHKDCYDTVFITRGPTDDIRAKSMVISIKEDASDSKLDQLSENHSVIFDARFTCPNYTGICENILREKDHTCPMKLKVVVTADKLGHALIYRTKIHHPKVWNDLLRPSMRLRNEAYDHALRLGTKARDFMDYQIREVKNGVFMEHRMLNTEALAQIFTRSRKSSSLNENSFKAMMLLALKHPADIHHEGFPSLSKENKAAPASYEPSDNFIYVITRAPALLQGLIFGHNIVFLDTTHRELSKNNVPMTALVTLDPKTGRGYPISVMISGNIKAPTLVKFMEHTFSKIRTLACQLAAPGQKLPDLALEYNVTRDQFHQWGQTWFPSVVMIDKCRAELTAIQEVCQGNYDQQEQMNEGISGKKTIPKKIMVALYSEFKKVQRAKSDEDLERLKQLFLETIIPAKVEELSSKNGDSNVTETVKSYFQNNWFCSEWKGMWEDYTLPEGISRDYANTNNHIEAFFGLFRVSLGIRLDHLALMIHSQIFDYFRYTSPQTRVDDKVLEAGSEEGVQWSVNLRATTCTCPDYQSHGKRCKHIYAADMFANNGYFDNEEVVEDTPALLNAAKREQAEGKSGRPAQLKPLHPQRTRGHINLTIVPGTGMQTMTHVPQVKKRREPVPYAKIFNSTPGRKKLAPMNKTPKLKANNASQSPLPSKPAEAPLEPLDDEVVSELLHQVEGTIGKAKGGVGWGGQANQVPQTVIDGHTLSVLGNSLQLFSFVLKELNLRSSLQEFQYAKHNFLKALFGKHREAIHPNELMTCANLWNELFPEGYAGNQIKSPMTLDMHISFWCSHCELEINQTPSGSSKGIQPVERYHTISSLPLRGVAKHPDCTKAGYLGLIEWWHSTIKEVYQERIRAAPPSCEKCHEVTELTYDILHAPPVLAFEVEALTVNGPSLGTRVKTLPLIPRGITLPVLSGETPVDTKYRLLGVIYGNGAHFNAQLVSPSWEVFCYDGLKGGGIAEKIENELEYEQWAQHERNYTASLIVYIKLHTQSNASTGTKNG